MPFFNNKKVDEEQKQLDEQTLLSSILHSKVKQPFLSKNEYVDRPYNYDAETKRKLLKVILSKHPEKNYERDMALGTGVGLGGMMGLSLLPLGRKPALLGGAAFGLAGAGLGYGIARGGRKSLERLSDDEKRKLTEYYLENFKKQTQDSKSDYHEERKDVQRSKANSMAGLASIGGGLAAGKVLNMSAKALNPMEDNILNELVENSGARKDLRVVRPEQLSPIVHATHGDNAFFSDKDNLVTATTKKLWKPGIMAHELGHANIHNSKGIVNFLQEHAYGPTTLLNNMGGGVLPTYLSYKANEKEENPWMGALKGGLIGTGVNAGVLVPEFEASRRAIVNLLKTKLSGREKLTNSLSLLPAFATYASVYGLPSAGVGAYQAYQNKKHKKKNEKLRKQQGIN